MRMKIRPCVPLRDSDRARPTSRDERARDGRAPVPSECTPRLDPDRNVPVLATPKTDRPCLIVLFGIVRRLVKSTGTTGERESGWCSLSSIQRGWSFFGLSFSSPSRTRLSAVATMDSSFERGDQPSRRLAFSLVAFFILPSSGRICFTAGSTHRGDAHQPVGQLPGRHSLGRRAHAALQHLGDVEDRQEIAGDGEEAFALGGGMSHGADVQVGDVAHIDDAEIEPRAAGHGAVHQALHQEDRGRIVGPQDRAEHAHRIDDGKLEVAAFARR